MIGSDYIKRHLLDYVNFQLEQGYELKDIKDALVKYGYHSSTVNEIISRARAYAEPKKRKTKYDIESLNKELYFYIQNLLIDYIVKLMQQGYSAASIRNALINFGHHPSMIDSALESIKKKRIVDLKSQFSIGISHHIIFAVSLFLVFVIIVVLSILTDENIGRVILAFLPCLVALIIVDLAYAAIGNLFFTRLLPFFAVGINALLFSGLLNISPSLRQMDTFNLMLMNCVLTFIFSAFICLLSKSEEKTVKENIELKEAKEEPKKEEPKKEPKPRKERLRIKEI